MATAYPRSSAEISDNSYISGKARLFGLDRLLAKAVCNGRLTLIDSGRRASDFGPMASKRHVILRLTDRWLPLRLLLDPPLAAGEAYMDGRLCLEKGTLSDLFALFGEGGLALYDHPLNRLRRPLHRLFNRKANSLLRARRNVEHHYDLPDALYALFLDADWQYSCAYFEMPGQSLEDAQTAKKRRIARKLLLRPGQKVLDIGSGWGGLALDLAKNDGVEVTGVTLSKEQLARAADRARSNALDRNVHFALKDYRHIRSQFDRIVSVGMFERLFFQ